MGKYLTIWKVDPTKIPIDPKERAAGWGMLMAMTEKDIQKGFITSWGAFVGQTDGYAVWECSEQELMSAVQQYIPFVFFEVHAAGSVAQVNDMIKKIGA